MVGPSGLVAAEKALSNPKKVIHSFSGKECAERAKGGNLSPETRQANRPPETNSEYIKSPPQVSTKGALRGANIGVRNLMFTVFRRSGSEALAVHYSNVN
jgi:hypothetical protein